MSQIQKKFIGDDQVGAAKIRLENDSFLTARDNGNVSDVNILKVNATDLVEFDATIAAAKFREISDSTNVLSIDLSGGQRLFYDGDAELAFDIGVSGLIIKPAGGAVSREIVFENGAGTDSIAVKAPSTLTSWTLTLPPDDGTAGYVLETDGAGVTSWVAPSGGGAPDFNKQTITLNGTDITNQYVDLSDEALVDSIQFIVKGGGIMLEGASHDYTVSYTGGGGGVTRITFANDLATAGAAALISGDILQIQYVVA